MGTVTMTLAQLKVGDKVQLISGKVVTVAFVAPARARGYLVIRDTEGNTNLGGHKLETVQVVR